jgi:hypothetical protein
MGVSDGPPDVGTTYGMVNLTRPLNVTDNKGHIAFIRNGSTIQSLGYLQGSNTFGWVASGNMNTTSGIFITSNGRVGIGITNPNDALDVLGVLSINNGVIAPLSPPLFQSLQLSYVGTGASGYGQIVTINPGSTYTSLCLNPVAPGGQGNVGIALTNPATKLHVNANGTVASGILVENAAANDSLAKTLLTGRASSTLMTSVAGAYFYFYGSTPSGVPQYAVIPLNILFTGQHANQPVDSDLKINLQNYIGFIVSSADQGYYSIKPITKEIITGVNAIAITEALPYIILTSVDQDPAVWGVLTNVKSDNYDTDGNIPLDNVDDGWGNSSSLSTMVRVNGLGEGAVWVTNINGPVQNGDLICSSIIPGYGRKQNDDLFHSYTVAKATMSCSFDLNNDNKYKCKTIEYNGTTYIAAFIGCSYHCS